TSSHLVMEYFRLLAGFETSPVPYRGAASMVSDFIAGQFKVSFGSTSGLLPLATAGKIRALAVSTAQRSPLVPDVPTIAESGYPAHDRLHSARARRHAGRDRDAARARGPAGG